MAEDVIIVRSALRCLSGKSETLSQLPDAVYYSIPRPSRDEPLAMAGCGARDRAKVILRALPFGGYELKLKID